VDLSRDTKITYFAFKQDLCRIFSFVQVQGRQKFLSEKYIFRIKLSAQPGCQQACTEDLDNRKTACKDIETGSEDNYMDIKVTFRHTEPMESLKAYAEEKISKIDRFLDSHAEAHIVLGVEKFRHQADVTLNLNGTIIKAVEETEDMYSAIDQVMDKLEKQVKRHLSKIRNHRTEHARNETKISKQEFEDTSVSSSDEFIIEEEKVVAKPMDPEEAAMQLNLSNKDFLVFRNAKSNKLNVIYKKADGNLGLIRPT